MEENKEHYIDGIDEMILRLCLGYTSTRRTRSSKKKTRYVHRFNIISWTSPFSMGNSW